MTKICAIEDWIKLAAEFEALAEEYREKAHMAEQDGDIGQAFGACDGLRYAAARIRAMLSIIA